MHIVRAGIPQKDHCPILTRIKAFIVDQGIPATLEHIFRDRQGNPIDISNYTNTPNDPDRDPPPHPPEGIVVLRVKDWLGVGMDDIYNPVWEIQGTYIDINNGVVQAKLELDIVQASGIYELSWGIRDRYGDLVYVNNGILSVERSMYTDIFLVKNRFGPPTLNEIRMWMMDSAPSENYLLDEIEFSDEQILLAITEPVRLWNETPPPIRRYNTRNFPYMHHWAIGILGELYEMAAHHYRRNFLQTSGGGVAVADKAKEKDYLAEALRLKQEYKSWLINKKLELNIRNYYGSYGSPYGGWY